MKSEGFFFAWGTQSNRRFASVKSLRLSGEKLREKKKQITAYFFFQFIEGVWEHEKVEKYLLVFEKSF